MSEVTPPPPPPPPPPAVPPVPPPPPSAYPPPAGGGQPGKGKAIAALILGIVSVALCLYWFIAIPAGIVAIILGLQARRVGIAAGQATAGLITGIIGVALSGVLVLLGLMGGGLDGYCDSNPDSAICSTQ